MHKKLAFIGVALVVAATSTVAWADVSDVADAEPARLDVFSARAGGLTADEVARRAAASSPQVRVKTEDVSIAASGVDQAVAGLFPRVSLLARYTRLSAVYTPTLSEIFPGFPLGTSGDMPLFAPILDSTMFQASLALPLSSYLLSLTQAYASATRSRDSASLSEKATRLKVAADARLLYYGWVRALGQQKVAERSVEQVKAHLVDVKNLFLQGMVSQADVLAVDSQSAQTELLAERARNLALVLEDQLRIAMHDKSPGGGRYEVGEDLVSPVEAPVLPPIDDLVNEAFHARLELRSLDLARRSLDDQYKIARAGALPRIDAFGDLLYADPNQRILPARNAFDGSWDLGIQLSWSPSDLGYGIAGMRNIDAQSRKLLATEDGLRDGVRVELMQAATAMREAVMASSTTARGLASAAESYRVRRELFKNGRATSIELTDAESELTRSWLEAINARIDLRVARVKLDHATGRDVQN